MTVLYYLKQNVKCILVRSKSVTVFDYIPKLKTPIFLAVSCEREQRCVRTLVQLVGRIVERVSLVHKVHHPSRKIAPVLDHYLIRRSVFMREEFEM